MRAGKTRTGVGKNSEPIFMSSMMSLPDMVNFEETEETPDLELIKNYGAHLKFMTTTSGVGIVKRSIVCLGADAEEQKILHVEDKTNLVSKFKSCLDFQIYEKSKSSRPNIKLLNLKLFSNLVLWVRDGQNRYLGSVRTECGTQNLSILDALGRPCIIIEREDPKKKDSREDVLSDDQSTRKFSYRCAKTGLILATSREFCIDLKPQSKPTKAITLDFRSKHTQAVDPYCWKRRLLSRFGFAP